MAAHGGGPAPLREGARRGRRAIMEFKLWQSLILVGIFVGGALAGIGAFDWAPVEPGIVWVATIVTPAVILIVRMPFLFGRATSAGDERVRALGLETVELPSLTIDWSSGHPAPVPTGRTAAAGRRHGRRVEVVIAKGESLTGIEAEVPAFTVRSDGGKLRADASAPDAVAESVRSLRKARRWRGIELRAAEGRVVVERRDRLADGWIYDLWLAERLLEALAR